VAQYEIMSAEPEITLYYGRCGVPNRLLSFEAGSDVSDIQLPRAFSGMVYDDGQPVEEEVPVEEVGSTEDTFYDENLTEFRQHEPIRAAQLESLIAASRDVQQKVREELGSVQREATPTFVTAEGLRERAKNQFSTSIRGMRASGATLGNHRLHAQTSVYIADVGGRFSGTWYLSQVRHIVNSEGYRTEFQCQR